MASEPLKHFWIVHFSARAHTTGNRNDVGARTTLKSVPRIHAQTTASIDYLHVFRHGTDIKRRQPLASTSDGENLKWPAEVEHLDFIKDDNTDSSWVSCLRIHRVLGKRMTVPGPSRDRTGSSNKVDLRVNNIPITWLVRYD